MKKIPIEALKIFIDSITNTLEKKGDLFSKIHLENIQQKQNNLFADLKIEKSHLRKIDTTIIKGYDNFPRSYLKNYLIQERDPILNINKIAEISKNIKDLNFVSEIKSPEILFTKDSTLLYLYLKKDKINNFDGLLNFSSDENNNLLFTGYLNLELNNILNRGESFSLLWKANGKQSQNFNIKTTIPYIFNSRFTPELQFNIHKQDSTFLNTKLNTRLLYNYSNKSSIGITYKSENSIETLINTVNDSIADFSNSFIGILYSHRISKQDIFNNDKFYFEINPSIGERNSEQQFQLNLKLQYIFDFSKKSSFYINNQSGYLNSEDILTNELYRIGGVNSIRGFNEESIFTSKYTYFNTEYRYLTSPKSYIYSITDFGYFKAINSNENKQIFSLGIGYLFRINNSQLNINYNYGVQNAGLSSNNSSRISIYFKNFF